MNRGCARMLALLLALLILLTEQPVMAEEIGSEELAASVALEMPPQQQTPLPEPTAVPTPVPTPESTPVPTPEPTAVPTPVPTPQPTAVPTPESTPETTAVPTPESTPETTAVPTPVPTPGPTAEPECHAEPDTSSNPAAEVAAQAVAEPTSQPAAEAAQAASAEETAEQTQADSNEQPPHETAQSVPSIEWSAETQKGQYSTQIIYRWDDQAVCYVPYGRKYECAVKPSISVQVVNTGACPVRVRMEYRGIGDKCWSDDVEKALQCGEVWRCTCTLTLNEADIRGLVEGTQTIGTVSLAIVE